ncbi:MAG: DUF1015 family protein, partial [Candidatus Peribacteria bacterium]|nr:DUF1015 family protein [Candidatus Peribacteria bacterium]
ARFALVELNNVHEEGITFEPIHRILFTVDEATFFREAKAHFAKFGSELDIQSFATKQQIADSPAWDNQNVHTFQAVNANGYYLFTLHNPQLNLEVGNLQHFLDEYLSIHSETKIDYVH